MKYRTLIGTREVEANYPEIISYFETMIEACVLNLDHIDKFTVERVNFDSLDNTEESGPFPDMKEEKGFVGVRKFIDEVAFKSEEKHDPVNRPSHYTDGKIEVIDFIEDKNLGFHLGNTVKYVARAGKKDPSKELEDLKKAAWYLNRRIENLEAK